MGNLSTDEGRHFYSVLVVCIELYGSENDNSLVSSLGSGFSRFFGREQLINTDREILVCGFEINTRLNENRRSIGTGERRTSRQHV